MKIKFGHFITQMDYFIMTHIDKNGQPSTLNAINMCIVNSVQLLCCSVQYKTSLGQLFGNE